MATLKDMTNALLQSGIGQTELAGLAGTSQSTISRISSGDTRNPGTTIGREIERLYLARVVAKQSA
ncbi:MAG: hypothetical protein CME59_02340 [Halioglobus sp.]|mgnify:FL=1|nr:hypothetical protein [Halioglobus sp.]|tara:strand:- start:1416 stop:1613 length:198 start_codon:yes stop_codon:yes gene_type:complete